VNAFGLVETALGEAGQLDVAFEKIVYLDTEEQARRFAEGIQVKFEEAGAVLQVTTNREDVERRQGAVGFETHLRLRLPPGTALVVRNEHGRVDVSDAASLELESSYEPVAVRRVGGDAKLDTRHADVTAEGIQGALTLSSRYGEIEASDVVGPASLDVEHGDVSVQRTAGLTLTHRYGELTAEDVSGELKITGEHNGVSAVKLGARVLIENGYRDVSLREVAGETSVTAQHAEVEVNDARGALIIKTSYGDVKLGRIAGPVEVSVEHGALHAQGLAAGLRGQVSGDDVTLEAFQGPVNIEASRAGVRLLPQGRLEDDVHVVVRNGSIRLAVPDDSRFALEASVASGQIELEKLTGLTLTRSDGDRIVGHIGEGGGRVTLEVDHGDITLEPRVSVAAKEE
jgi:DUF4097 and DUF4098 domain-containing protein YvlB